MTRYMKMLKTIEKKGKDKLTFSEKDEISNAIWCDYLSEDHQKGYQAFSGGYTAGKGWFDPLEIMDAYLYWLEGNDSVDALRELVETSDEKWEGLK